MSTVARAALTGPVLEAARGLLGTVLVASSPEGPVAVRLTEVEAYAGAVDPASHAFRGPTPRNAVMFGPAGHLYVYFVYGMHWCCNVVCGPPDQASAVLLRAGEVVDGAALARSRRPTARTGPELARGPARLATALGITGRHNGVDLVDPAGSLRLLAAQPVPDAEVCRGPRVGVAAAGELQWRLWVRGDASVSAYRLGGRRRRTGTTVTG